VCFESFRVEAQDRQLTWSEVIDGGQPGNVFLRTRASQLESTPSQEGRAPLDPLEAIAQLRRCDIKQRQVVLGQPPVPARADCQRADPFSADFEPADFDPTEPQRSCLRLAVAVADRLEAGGAKIDAFYYCPHYPDGVLEEYRTACDCRKPQPGLLRRAAVDMEIDLERSFVVGDRWHDLAAGHAVGARGVLVRTGLGWKDEAASHAGTVADAIVDNLMEAAAWILQQA